MNTIYDIWLDRLPSMTPEKKLTLAKSKATVALVYEFAARCGYPADLNPAREQLDLMQAKGIKSVCYFDEHYPEALRNIFDPPWMLYYIGEAAAWERPAVSVVGARKASDYGKWVAFRLGECLAHADVTVVSGMAYGADTQAHLGALSGGGLTIAVMGCGVDICYPKSALALRNKICENGAIVSEFLPQTAPLPFRFPMRNRLISGFSRAVVVAEAGLSSGSLITAELAAEQGKEVFSVPGNINQINSLGGNQLIRDGAIPIVVLGDVLTYLGLGKGRYTESSQSNHLQLGEDEKKVLSVLEKEGESTVDTLCRRLLETPGKMNGLVSVLEMKGAVQTAFGKVFIAK